MQIKANYALLEAVVKGERDLAGLDSHELMSVALCDPKFNSAGKSVVERTQELCLTLLKDRLESDWNTKLRDQIKHIIEELYPVTKIDQFLDGTFHVQYKLADNFWDWVHIESPHDAVAFVAKQRAKGDGV